MITKKRFSLKQLLGCVALVAVILGASLTPQLLRERRLNKIQDSVDSLLLCTHDNRIFEVGERGREFFCQLRERSKVEWVKKARPQAFTLLALDGNGNPIASLQIDGAVGEVDLGRLAIASLSDVNPSDFDELKSRSKQEPTRLLESGAWRVICDVILENTPNRQSDLLGK